MSCFNVAKLRKKLIIAVLTYGSFDTQVLNFTCSGDKNGGNFT